VAKKALRSIRKKNIENFQFNENVCFFSNSSLNQDLIETLFENLPESEDSIYCRFTNETFDEKTICSFIAFKKFLNRRALKKMTMSGMNLK